MGCDKDATPGPIDAQAHPAPYTSMGILSLTTSFEER